MIQALESIVAVNNNDNSKKKKEKGIPLTGHRGL
jgi:hypothetical protein